MRITTKIFLFFSLLAIFAAVTNAHPLGNFSINNFIRIEVEKDRIRLHGIVDMAEIPTFQESQKIDINKDGTLDQEELSSYLDKITPSIVAKYNVLIDGQPAEIQTVSKEISVPMGSGNLPTLKMKWLLSIPLPPNEKDSIHHLSFTNNNFQERVGWNEIVVNRMPDISVFDSTAFGTAVTDELKSYPENMLLSPLAERKAEFSFTASSILANGRMLEDRNGAVSAPVQKDKFAELIAIPEITPSLALVGLLLAFGFGAMHAMSPGHGKAVVGAYLVGSRGTFKHAVFLGLTVTVTHTIGVFAIGLITLFASNYILPERLMPVLTFVSGLLVFYIGMTLFKDRALAALELGSHHAHSHEHSNENDASYVKDFSDANQHENAPKYNSQAGVTHTHGGSTHTHLPPNKVTWKNLLTLGVSGGLLPCPSALVLMLAAISRDRVGYGLILTIAFSFGLAATLTAIGLLFLYVGKSFSGSKLADSRVFKMLPVFSAFVITCMGAIICYNAFI